MKVHRRRKHRKNRKHGSSKRGSTKFASEGFYKMITSFLADNSGIDMDDKNEKVVPYTWQTKEIIPEELHLPRKSTFWV